MTIPIVLTLLRAVLAVLLLVLAWFGQVQPAFWTLVAALGTDALDGYLARALHQVTPLGARLDSHADLVLFLTLPVGLWWLFPATMGQHALILYILFGVYVLGVTVGFARFRRLTSYHTWGAKLAAVLLGGTVLLRFQTDQIGWVLYPSAIVAILAYLEEIAITLTLPAWAADVHSLWAARQLVADAVKTGRSGRA